MSWYLLYFDSLLTCTRCIREKTEESTYSMRTDSAECFTFLFMHNNTQFRTKNSLYLVWKRQSYHFWYGYTEAFKTSSCTLNVPMFIIVVAYLSSNRSLCFVPSAIKHNMSFESQKLSIQWLHLLYFCRIVNTSDTIACGSCATFWLDSGENGTKKDANCARAGKRELFFARFSLLTRFLRSSTL